MKKQNLVTFFAVPLIVLALAMPVRAADTSAPTTCKDGTASTATGRGACSGHGGVQKAPKAKGADASGAANSAAVAPSATAAPSAATAPPAGAAKAAPASKAAPTSKAANTDPTGATAKCKDGTYSKSKHHAGTCSSHGGVAEWITAQ